MLRLTGLYLALATLAFAAIMDKMLFQADFAFGFNGVLPAERLSILGTSFSSTGGYVFVMAVFLVLTAWAVLLLRRGVVGRLLLAMRDSPAACGTLGLDLRWFRVGLFALSAGIAGLAGALFAGLRQTVGAGDFIYFQSLLLLLCAAVFGVTSVTGAVLGGVALMLLPVLQERPVGRRAAVRRARGGCGAAGPRPQRLSPTSCSRWGGGSSGRSPRGSGPTCPRCPARPSDVPSRRAGRRRHVRGGRGGAGPCALTPCSASTTSSCSSAA